MGDDKSARDTGARRADSDVESILREWGATIACAQPDPGEAAGSACGHRVLWVQPPAGALGSDAPRLRAQAEELRAAHRAAAHRPLHLVVDLRDSALPALSSQMDLLRVLSSTTRDWYRDSALSTDAEDEENTAEGEVEEEAAEDSPGQVRGVIAVSGSVVARQALNFVGRLLRKRSSPVRFVTLADPPSSDEHALALLA